MALAAGSFEGLPRVPAWACTAEARAVSATRITAWTAILAEPAAFLEIGHEYTLGVVESIISRFY